MIPPNIKEKIKMDKCMIECLKKLALWYTKTFKPIMSHEELEFIMSTLGFIALPANPPTANGVVWKEYHYPAKCYRSLSTSTSSPPPNARLPSFWINGRHRIDGLHVYTYRAFIDAVKTNLDKDDVSDLFHVRGMPLQPMTDWSKKLCRMEGDESIYVYKEGTLDAETRNLYHPDNNDDVNNSNNNNNNRAIRDKGRNISVGTIVPLNDIIVRRVDL